MQNDFFLGLTHQEAKEIITNNQVAINLPNNTQVHDNNSMNIQPITQRETRKPNINSDAEFSYLTQVTKYFQPFSLSLQ